VQSWDAVHVSVMALDAASTPASLLDEVLPPLEPQAIAAMEKKTANDLLFMIAHPSRGDR
jgi:hypothetical protein